jgi:hypothetical protein
MTKIDFPGFPGLDFGILKFHDFPGFPGPVRTLSLIWNQLTCVALYSEGIIDIAFSNTIL